MQRTHHVQHIEFKEDEMYLNIDDQECIFLLEKISKKLFAASANERAHYKISPSDYGIHWPLLDEDLSVDGLPGI